MGKRDERIDKYIAESADFAIPILTYFREIVHKACPDVKETIKWSFPHFDYKGSMMCSMASFKQHCAISFWKAALMTDAETLIKNANSEVAMGHLGRITAKKDLPKKGVLVGYIKEAMRLNEDGIKVSQAIKPVANKELEVPDYFTKALSKNKKAMKTFDEFSYSNKKEYLDWVTGAKTEVTRLKRLKEAVEWMGEGKIRHWKYIK